MNRQNFDTSSVGNYPLTIDRMAEAQGDWLAPMGMLAKVLPAGNCIIAGCESKGAAGWVRMMNENSQPEVFEVRSGSSSASYLKLTQQDVTAENSDGDTVIVRRERYLTWAANGSGTYCVWADLPRIRVRLAKQDDSTVSYLNGGLWWHVPTTGSALCVQRTGGRVHLQGSVKYGLQLAPAVVTYTGRWEELATEHSVTKTLRDDVPVLPQGYRPDGDILIPVRYNGAASFAVIDSDGQLMLPQEHELGDTLEIDTWIEI